MTSKTITPEELEKISEWALEAHCAAQLVPNIHYRDDAYWQDLYSMLVRGRKYFWQYPGLKELLHVKQSQTRTGL